MKTQVLYTLTTALTVALFPTASPKTSNPASDLQPGASSDERAEVFPSVGRADSDGSRIDFAWESGAFGDASLMQANGSVIGKDSGFSTKAKTGGKNDPLAWEVVDGKKSGNKATTGSIAELAQANTPKAPVTGAADAADKKAPAAPTNTAAPAKKSGAVDLRGKKPAASISDLVGGDKKTVPAAGAPKPGDPMPSDPMEAIEGDEDGFFIRGAQLNDVFQFLAKSAELNYFHNAELAAPSYVVTGHLQDGEPIKQMEELGLMYGITIHQKGKTVYAMTEGQLAQLPVKPFQYHMNYLRPADIEQIKNLLTPILTPGRGSVDYESKTNTLIVIDNEQKVEALQEILKQLDQPKRQVSIEMRILRVTSGSRNSIGVDWTSVLGPDEDGLDLGAISSLNNLFNLPDLDTATEVITLDNSVVSTGTVTSNTTTATPIPGVIPPTTGSSTLNDNLVVETTNDKNVLNTRQINTTGSGLVLSPIALDAVMRALNTGNLAEQESSPTVITEDNEQAIISIIDRVPIIVATVNQTSAGSNITEEVRYRIDTDDPVDDPANTREVGVTMTVTPTILPDNSIRMVMRPRSAQIVEFVIGQTGNRYPRVNESTVDTIARVPDGSSLLIGGFYERANRDVENKVPVLGDIPWLNFMFKYSDKQKTITSLVFVVTPSAYDAESPQKTMEMTKRLHDHQVLPFDHNWPDRKNPGFNHEAHLGNSLGNALKLYPEVPEWNPLMAEHPINEEKTSAAEAQQIPANHRQPKNPLLRIFGFGKN